MVGEGVPLVEMFVPTGTGAINPGFFVGEAVGSTTLNESLEL